MKWFSLAAVLAVVPVVGFLSSQRSAVRSTAPAQETVQSYRYLPVDFDGDGLVDAYAIDAAGQARLLVQQQDGSFLDRTEAVGLGEVGPVESAYWADLTLDSRPELVALAPSGTLRLFVWELGAFVERTATLQGLIPAWVQSVAFEDYDGNGWRDLGLWGSDGSVSAVLNHGELAFTAGALGEVNAGLFQPQSAPGRQPLTPGLPPGTPGGGISPLGGCATQIVNQATSQCIEASSTPSLGKLYPVSSNLFVDGASGFVGINTTSPMQRLDVSGIVRAAGGIQFPDGSIQTTATVAGPAGAPGPEGPEGQPGTVLPAGTILMWGGSAAPAGFLLCNGASYDPVQFPQLAGAIGTTFDPLGVSFLLPDLRQRFPMGADSPAEVQLGETGGSLTHTHSIAGHSHGLGTLAISGGTHGHDITPLTVTGDGSHSHSATCDPALPDGSVGIRYVERQVVSTGGTVRRMLGYPNTGVDIQYTGADSQATVAGTNHNHGVTINGAGTHSHDVGGSVSGGSHSHTPSGVVGNTAGVPGDSDFQSGANNAGSLVDRNPPFVTVNYIIKI